MRRLIDADALMAEHCEGCAKDIQEMCKTDPVCASMMWVVEAPTVDAVEVNRLGKLGRLMMPHKGDPRGHIGPRGPSGCSGEDFRAIELDPITDVDGNRWIPVLEEDLCAMKARADDTVKVVHGHCDWCKPGEEHCGTCMKFFDYYGDGGSDSCSSEFCSVKCAYYIPVGYCPNCGAKMDGDGNG